MLSGIGFQEMLVIGIVAVLLFGRNLPKVARNAGSMYRDFRKQISDLQSTFTSIDLESDSKSSDSEEYFDDEPYESEKPSAPRFEPPSDDDSSDND